MKLRWSIPTGMILFLAVACGTEDELDEVHGSEPVISETEAGDFILRLVSTQEVYDSDEEIDLTAKLKYIGDQDEITITHAMSPFWFEIVETTRGVEIPHAMEMPQLETTLERDKWYEELYEKNGGYIEEDEDSEFIAAFLEGNAFPSGEYEIELRTDFNTVENGEDEEQHNYTTSLMIQVK
ncbi:hypothetical protein [Evansella halocellulosilytica]|uniref:hypothetical protein n=1 Tax=Evansella halocellulosilytica TaxID=2011013 RepID=UPI000BB70350|nr:hypothetical protein [Evansella halocellulosilytica]